MINLECEPDPTVRGPSSLDDGPRVKGDDTKAGFNERFALHKYFNTQRRL